MTTQKYLFLLPLFLLLPTPAFAATISLHASPQNIGVGDTVQVTILLDSDTPTNAFSGTMAYAGTALEPLSISDGSSIISFWITRPVVSATGAPITFAGITPGGFSGSGGKLLSILFRAKAAGRANVSLEDIQVLRNDGVGGNEPVTLKPLALSIAPNPTGGYTEPADNTPPEPFAAFLGKDSELFQGKNYLAFMAVDKGSGIDHYLIVESRLPSFLFSLFPHSWNETTSPYVLADQNLTSTLYIKAVDRSGNERISIFSRPHYFTSYEKVILLVILIIVILLSHMRWGRRFEKNL